MENTQQNIVEENQNDNRKSNYWWLASFLSLVLFVFVIFPAFFSLPYTDFSFRIGVAEFATSSLFFFGLLAVFIACLIYNLILFKNATLRFFIGFAGFCYIVGSVLILSFGGVTEIGIPISKCSDYKIIARALFEPFREFKNIEIMAQAGDSYQYVGTGVGGGQNSSKFLFASTKPSDILLYDRFWQSDDYKQLFVVNQRKNPDLNLYKDIYLIDDTNVSLVGTMVSSPSQFNSSDIFKQSSPTYIQEKDKISDPKFWQSKDFQKFVSCVDKDILANTYLSI